MQNNSFCFQIRDLKGMPDAIVALQPYLHLQNLTKRIFVTKSGSDVLGSHKANPLYCPLRNHWYVHLEANGIRNIQFNCIPPTAFHGISSKLDLSHRRQKDRGGLISALIIKAWGYSERSSCLVYILCKSYHYLSCIINL